MSLLKFLQNDRIDYTTLETELGRDGKLLHFKGGIIVLLKCKLAVWLVYDDHLQPLQINQITHSLRAVEVQGYTWLPPVEVSSKYNLDALIKMLKVIKGMVRFHEDTIKDRYTDTTLNACTIS